MCSCDEWQSIATEADANGCLSCVCSGFTTAPPSTDLFLDDSGSTVDPIVVYDGVEMVTNEPTTSLMPETVPGPQDGTLGPDGGTTGPISTPSDPPATSGPNLLDYPVRYRPALSRLLCGLVSLSFTPVAPQTTDTPTTPTTMATMPSTTFVTMPMETSTTPSTPASPTTASPTTTPSTTASPTTVSPTTTPVILVGDNVTTEASTSTSTPTTVPDVITMSPERPSTVEYFEPSTPTLTTPTTPLATMPSAPPEPVNVCVPEADNCKSCSADRSACTLCRVRLCRG